ncbi:MAG: response regulator [Clostridia bacterium]|nr:response regulator [Clostridia bacterium]
MVRGIVYTMVYAGSALMVYNIYGFARLARYIRKMKTWRRGNRVLYLPILLLVCFLLGYLLVGLFGNPNLLVAGILFGGSIFVFVMYNLLNTVIQHIVEGEHLEAQLLAAEESNRVKSSFLASISHEMRTPMNVILGMDTLALKNPDIPGETREQLEKIGHSARHLSELINGILDLQQMESGTLKIETENFSLGEALEQINVLISAACRDKGLEYKTDFSPCASRKYNGDVVHLKQAVMCLLDNAVKFTDPPGTVRFTVSCDRENGVCSRLRFIVADDGIGIEEAFLPKVLEPFAQEDDSFTNRFGGSGMGLALANNIVTHMGGYIEVASKKGEGSTFTIILPINATGCMEQQKPENGARCCCCGKDCKSECCEMGSAELEGRRVLIAEDIAENAEIVMDLLELEGVESEWAENGQLAVDRIKGSLEGYYDAILMDLRMPVMDGLEAARQIRALDREDVKRMPILALTANAAESDKKNTLEAGMNEHLVKPVDADQLYAALRHWIFEAEKKGDDRA